MYLIKSCVFKPATKFVVTDKSEDNVLGPGTTGFISFINGVDQDYKNVVHYNTTIIRRGKSGKERLETGQIAMLSTPIFDFDVDKEEFKSLMPNKKRRNYVYISKSDSLSLENMPDIEFLAWASAFIQYIHKLCTKANRVSPWPADGTTSALGNTVNAFLNDFLYIEDFYSETPEQTKEIYGNIEVRKDFIKRIRAVELTLCKCIIDYLCKTSYIELQAISCMKAQYEKPPKEILSALDFYNRKYNILNRLNTSNTIDGIPVLLPNIPTKELEILIAGRLL